MDMNDLEIFIDKDHVQWNIGVFHPEMMHLITRVDKDHTRAARHILPEHEPTFLVFWRHSGFGLESADLFILTIKNRYGNRPDLTRSGYRYEKNKH